MTTASAASATRPTISATTATAIVVADMVGVGVFTSLGFQVKEITSGFALLLLWIVGGIVALCGAAAYSELAGMFPRSSGEYNYLARSYRPAIGFMAGFLSATVGFAAPIAVAAMAFGHYFRDAMPAMPTVAFELGMSWPLAIKLAITWQLILGLGVAWLIALVHLRGVRSGSLFHNVWTTIKLALIVAFLVAGFTVANPQPISFAPTLQGFGYVTTAPFAISLVFVMYSYSGWNAATYIAGEIRDPHRSLPRALMIGTLIVLALYVALNAVFLRVAPIDKLAGQVDVAAVAGRYMFGEVGARVVGGLICLGLVSSISAMTWIGPRVTMTMGEDVPMLRMFARTTRNGVPAWAILLQLLIVNVMLLTGSFEAIVDFIGFSLTACSFLAVLGVIKLRLTHPKLPRPYRAWGYPLTPVIFLVVTGFMLYYLVISRPVQSLAGFAMMLAGLAIYGASHFRPSAPSSPPSAVENVNRA
jgi:basic amino acid/polyamine antiporter, APA family